MKKFYWKVIGFFVLSSFLLVAFVQHYHANNSIHPAIDREISGSFNFIKAALHQPHPAIAATGNLSREMETTISQQASRSEYFIRWQQHAGAYQSPNRKNGLRTTFNGDEVAIAPLQNQIQEWAFNLSVKGIAADDQLIYQPAAAPETMVHENTIRFNHAGAFTVEYINTDAGIRQNFIVHRQPAHDAKKLTVVLEPAAGWTMQQQSGEAIRFKKREQTLDYSDLKVWDAEGKPLSACLAICGKQLSIAVNATNAVYPVTIDPIVANGTPQNANSFLQSNQNYASLGAVSNAGDVNNDGYDDVIVGFPWYDNGQTNEGVAFVYYGTSNGVNPFTGTMLERNTASASFGSDVSSAGDVNNDGYDDVFVGARSQPGGGVAMVYYGSASGISTTTTDVVPVGNSQGTRIAEAGDVNGDGYDDVIAGSWEWNSYRGIAYVFYGGPWGIVNTPSSTLTITQNGAEFGYDVHGAGDVNGDGYDDVIVGAQKYDNGQTDEGAAFIFYGSSGGINTTPATTLESNQTNSYYGLSVAGPGDINGDGYDDVAVGAQGYSNGHSREGAVFIYYGGAGGVNTSPATFLESNVVDALYGSSVSGAGDVNGDGRPDLIVGAKWYSNGQSEEGMAFVYYGRTAGLNTTAASSIQSNQAGADLGASVSGAGDVNGDGYADVIVGAADYANGQSQEGAAFVYLGGLAPAKMQAPPRDPKPNEEVATVHPPTLPGSTSIKVYPNPVINSLTIQLAGLDDHASTSIKVINMNGQVLQTYQAGKLMNGNQLLDFSKWSKGVYVVEIVNGKNVSRHSIVKQ